MYTVDHLCHVACEGLKGSSEGRCRWSIGEEPRKSKKVRRTVGMKDDSEICGVVVQVSSTLHVEFLSARYLSSHLNFHPETVDIPTYQRSKQMHQPPQVILTIYSHTRSPPLHPPPDLKHYLRSIPNPPKAPRDKQPCAPNSRSIPDEADVAGYVFDDVEATKEDASDDSTNNENIHFRAGYNYALGHHHSAAFVEELSKHEWPREWHIEVVHRDLGTKRVGGVRAKQKSMFEDKRCDMWEQ
ncbi:hypothetical protein P280DRAFT_476016 [Massarina eburnea CBS 473.64]|uniref:Uncharacterized protein n=1 Tax=Massarina eburnea CBS 473.64 TaxID=1395130 RepID=A0A6A6SFM2_9PLEO|nr:hypothetical protein P280DRAFT_476016 [Massarina eburnea CBS 473.64]